MKVKSLFMLLPFMISMIFNSALCTNESIAKTLALWHFDQIQTPDATGNDNVGILGGDPPPMPVEGKFGKALSFDGNNFVYVPFSPSLYTPEDITIEAWIYVRGFKDHPYNNILTIAYRSGLEWTTVTRVCGIALTPAGPINQTDKCYLRGYIYTDKAYFNEIITSKPVINIGQWVHVAFVRSLSTGLHLYINGEEVDVNVTYGVRNPKGNIIMGTDIIIGHDAILIIDEPRICNAALEPSQFMTDLAPALAFSRTEIDIGPNLMIAIIVAAIAFAVAWLLRRVIQTWGLGLPKLRT